MSLRDRLQQTSTAAMRSGDALRRDTCGWRERRLQRREAQPATAHRGRVPGVLTREVKTRRESVEAFRNGDREDLATKEEAEIAILVRVPAPGS